MPRNRSSLQPQNRSTQRTRTVATLGGLAGIVLAVVFLLNISDRQRQEVIRLDATDGDLTILTGDTILNQYAALAADVAAGSSSLQVDDAARLDAQAPLAAGDLLLVIQMQGAALVLANDTSFGRVSDYGSAGNYEFVRVAGVQANTITLQCALLHDYTEAGHTQVVRVPQYGTLRIAGGGRVVAPAWDGATGGIVAVAAATVVEIDGAVVVDGAGFRGGMKDNTTDWAQTLYYTAAAGLSAARGEGIGGGPAEYAALGIPYGRGAAANGGGGGNAHNCGGGGGANGHNGAVWTGQGQMCDDCTGSAAWALDPAYAEAGGAFAQSSGGGRGGYSYAGSNRDALTEGPGNSAWGGDARRANGGLGGRPVASDPASRLFMGGGGGAGDGNNSAAGSGGSGGGIVILVSPTVRGSGTIAASGSDGTHTSAGHNDAPGGGGGGGTILIKAQTLAGLTLTADGGQGGDQYITNNESEGPGGGGGGGYLALPEGHSATCSVQGGANGTTTSLSLTEFTANGATRGAPGQIRTTAFGIPFCTETDSDGDGIPDLVDLDDDNDGLPDWEELGCSRADFGTAACPDPAILTSRRVPRYADPDSCAGQALVNGVCPTYDLDGDGVPDHLDRDSDNDGLPDLIEAQGTDQEGDGMVDDFVALPTRFTITLALTDDEGAVRYLQEEISLGYHPPVARFTTQPGGTWAELILDAATAADDGTIASYAWDFGDNQTATGAVVSHTYSLAGTYAITLTVTDDDGHSDTYRRWYEIYPQDPCDLVPGSIVREYWTGISGSDVASLTGNGAYPDHASGSSTLTSFTGPTNTADNYGTRVRGYLLPPTSGNYSFWVTGDDEIQLWLSTDASPGNATQVCHIPGHTGTSEFTKYSTQHSATIALTGGVSYYIELLHKEGGGGDHFAVYWDGPGIASRTLIDAAYLAPWQGVCTNRLPLPDIAVSAYQGSSGLMVTFDASAATDPDGSIRQYFWIFGDGDTASGAVVSHTFVADYGLDDSDGDGWADRYDNDPGQGYTGGTPLTPPDTDGDGLPDYRDLDSDGDGLTDLYEAGGSDADQNGIVDVPDDADGDGFADALDPDEDGVRGVDTGQRNQPLLVAATAGQPTGNAGRNLDPDTDSRISPYDIDSDGDGILDWTEAQPSGIASPTDGLTAPAGIDVDGDGIDDAFDNHYRSDGSPLFGSPLTPPDTDGDSLTDNLDTDSDNDGLSDLLEGHDQDNNGTADYSPTTTDSDGDGLDDGFDPLTDRNDPSYAADNATQSRQAVQDANSNVASGGERDWREVSGMTFPVAWAGVAVQQQGADALLTWATSTESNSDFFAVERADDGQQFTPVGRVQAAGQAQTLQSYDFLDPGVASLGSSTLYYRLRQVDFDGSFDYSATVVLQLQTGTGTVAWGVYPNPAEAYTHLRLDAGAPGTWTWQLVSIDGRTLRSGSIEAIAGRAEQRLDLAGLAAGTYVLQAGNGSQRHSVKLIVQ
ncbi:MAG: hypothetical protein OHK0039_40060 [Bacteroidia bacterium]